MKTFLKLILWLVIWVLPTWILVVLTFKGLDSYINNSVVAFVLCYIIASPFIFVYYDWCDKTIDKYIK